METETERDRQKETQTDRQIETFRDTVRDRKRASAFLSPGHDVQVKLISHVLVNTAGHSPLPPRGQLRENGGCHVPERVGVRKVTRAQAQLSDVHSTLCCSQALAHRL